MPPLPRDPTEAARWLHTRLRRAMLDGNWLDYLEQARGEHFGSMRTRAHGPADQSANPFRVINRELAVCHHVPPDALHGTTPSDDPSLTGLLGPGGIIDKAALWPMMRRFDQWVLGCNEYLMRAHADSTGRTYYRPVAPDFVTAEGDPDDPSRMVRVSERRIRPHPERPSEDVWTVEDYDIRDPATPTMRIHVILEDGTWGPDMTGHYLPESAGESWPAAYRTADGVPVIPYVLYHKARLGDRLFDAYDGIEIVKGSITLAVMLSFWVHCVRDAGHPQRWAANARVQGLEIVDAGGNAARLETVTDPATLLMLEAIEAGNQIMVGQFQPGADVKMMLESIDGYAARLATDAGLSGSDAQRGTSSARSGYAIALTNEGKRAAQKRYYEQFREGDQQIIALTAILVNRATGSSYPESGYSVVYREIPLSPDELRERRANVLELMREGLMDPADAYRELNPGLTKEQARSELERIRSGAPASAPDAEATDATTDQPQAEQAAPAETNADERVDEAGVEKLQDTALNGAQVASALQIVKDYISGAISHESGVAMLSEFFNLDPATAERLLGPKDFKPEAPDAAPPPFP